MIIEIPLIMNSQRITFPLTGALPLSDMVITNQENLRSVLSLFYRNCRCCENIEISSAA